MAHSIAWFRAESQRAQGVPAACFGGRDSRYRGREVGGGRATRQPGQVRKEAALTSTDRVARQPPTQFTAYCLARAIAPDGVGMARAFMRRFGLSRRKMHGRADRRTKSRLL